MNTMLPINLRPTATKRFMRLLAVVMIHVFTGFGIHADTAAMQQKLEQLYQDAYNQKLYGFIGGELYSYTSSDLSDLRPEAKVASGRALAFATVIKKAYTLPNPTEFHCLSSGPTACLVVYGDDSLLKKLAVITAQAGTLTLHEMPIEILPDHPCLAETGNGGWLVSSFSTGEVSAIGADGALTAIQDLHFDPKVNLIEIWPAWSNHRPQAAAVLVQKDTLLTNRRELAWALFEGGTTTWKTASSDDCLFEGIVDRTLMCAAVEGQGNTDIRTFRMEGKDTLHPMSHRRLGQVNLSGQPIPYRHGLLFSIVGDGHRKMLFVPAAASDTPVAEAINQQLEMLRTKGDLTPLDSNMADGALLLLQQSTTRPFKAFLCQPATDARQAQADFFTVRTINQGTRFFDPTGFVVDRRISATRHVPYTIVSHPGTHGPASRRAIVKVYGSFDLPLEEAYLREYGHYWLDQGGLFIFAHVRGGGGFGDAWRQAGRGIRKMDSVLDLEEVTSELTQSGIVDRGAINLLAESAGGIVAASAAIRHPDLFASVALTSPCLVLWDNARGVCTESDEFGNPLDPNQMTVMRRYSPGHLLAGAKTMVPFLIVQSTDDPIVPPAVTTAFLNIRPDLHFARVLELPYAVHGEQFSAKDMARVAAQRLAFFYEVAKSERHPEGKSR